MSLLFILPVVDAGVLYLISRKKSFDELKFPTTTNNYNNPLNFLNTVSLEGDAPTNNNLKNFKSLTYGYLAGMRQLVRYYNTYNIDTIYGMIKRWSGLPAGNVLNAYADFVTSKTLLGDKYNNFSLTQLNQNLLLIVHAMTWWEQGMYNDGAWRTPEIVISSPQYFAIIKAGDIVGRETGYIS